MRQALRGRCKLLVSEEAASWSVLGLIPVFDLAVFPPIAVTIVVVVIDVGRRRWRRRFGVPTVDAATVDRAAGCHRVF